MGESLERQSSHTKSSLNSMVDQVKAAYCNGDSLKPDDNNNDVYKLQQQEHDLERIERQVREIVLADLIWESIEKALSSTDRLKQPQILTIEISEILATQTTFISQSQSTSGGAAATVPSTTQSSPVSTGSASAPQNPRLGKFRERASQILQSISNDRPSTAPASSSSAPATTGHILANTSSFLSSNQPPYSPQTTAKHRSNRISLTKSSVDLIGTNAKRTSLPPIPSADLDIVDDTASISYTLERPTSKRKKKDQQEDQVAVGIKISEGHSAYVLMYDMLTGIRNAVSRCVAKPYRPLEKADFKGRHKITFDILGNELTPSSKYEFKFKDYAPWVFRYIREHFNIEAADYLVSSLLFSCYIMRCSHLQVSLTSKYVLSELGSPGKSGSFFYFSQDYRFIIKTIHHTEHKFMLQILEQYYEHIQRNPNTLLCRYYGLHRVKLPHGRKIHFVVMGNVFPPNKDIHETFDLKGSMVGREVGEEERKKNPLAPLKDLNWKKGEKRLHLGPIKSKSFLEQVEKDARFLMSLQIMDYSLLLGIHYLKRGNSERIRDNSLSVFELDHSTLTRQGISNKRSMQATTLRKVLAQSDPIQLGPSSNRFPEENPAERRGCIFYQDAGGFLATDENNNALNELYYTGIIDILTPYNFSKRAEHAFKSLSHDKNMISAVKPKRYGERFIEFMRNFVVRPGSSLSEKKFSEEKELRDVSTPEIPPRLDSIHDGMLKEKVELEGEDLEMQTIKEEQEEDERNISSMICTNKKISAV